MADYTKPINPNEPKKVEDIDQPSSREVNAGDAADEADAERQVDEGSQRRAPDAKYETVDNSRRQRFNIKMSEAAMQHLRLPGTSRVVVDRRRHGEEERGKGHKAEAKGDDKRAEKHSESGAIEIREGKAREAREKNYQNFLGDRKLPFKQTQAEQKPERPLSDFEKLVIERFENSKDIEQTLKGTSAKFGEKTTEQWREFFSKFEGRNQLKKTDLAEISEFLFRGLVKKGDSGKAVMISDIMLKNGMTDKFARFSVLYQQIANLVSKLVPGDGITKQQLADALFAEQIAYLALNPPGAESEIATAMSERMGIFAKESTEAWISSELGISGVKKEEAELRSQAARRGKRKKGGFFGALLSGEDDLVESGGQGVGWWSWGTLNKPGKLGVKRALYSFVFIIFVLLCLFLVDRFLLGK